MTKSEFLDILRVRTEALSESEAAKTVIFYSEMIDDRMEEGMSEEDAVAALGDVDGIVDEVCAGVGLPCEERVPKGERKKHRPWVIALLLLGSPLWITLIAAAAVTVLALYITALCAIWGIAVSIVAVEISLLAGGAASVLVGVLHFVYEGYGAGLFYAGAGLVLLGLGLLLFRPVICLLRLAAFLTKQIFVLPVKLFRNKGSRKNEE